MRKIVMAGLVAAAAMLGCAGPAFAGTGTAGSDSAAPQALSRAGGDGSLSFDAETTVSCGSATACLSVGTTIGGASAGFTPVAARWHAGTWKSVPVKSPKGAASALLTGVSCKAATFCMVAGEYDTFPGSGAAIHSYLLTWNGSALTPVAALPVPKADELGAVTGVSCFAVNGCVATGIGDVLASQNDSVQFVWTWNGAKWTVATVHFPSGTGGMFTGLHCFSPSSCVAVGASFVLSSTGGSSTNIVAHWNGKTFTNLKAPFPAGVSGGFTDLSCVSAHSCAVVGLEDASSSNPLPRVGLAEVWNGKTWSVTNWRGPAGGTEAELRGVSCTSAARCVAVGAHGTATAGAAAALAWDGRKWTVLKVPGPGAGKAAVFDGVSCPVNGTCVATGETGKVGAQTETPLAGFWNGRGWKLSPM